MKHWMLITAGFLALGAVQARTILLTDHDVNQMATLNAKVPTASWASIAAGEGVTFSYLLNLPTIEGVMIRFPLERIPREQRIVNAELTLPVYTIQAGTKLLVWRMLVDWGPGASHLYRRTIPTRVQWSIPGAQGTGVDHAVQPTSVIVRSQYAAHFPLHIDITKDVEQWYAGVAPNNGWLLTIDDPATSLNLKPPFVADGVNLWQLKITYEPL